MIKSRRMRWAGHVAGMGESRGIYRVLVRRNLRERDRFVRPRRTWEYNVKMDVQKLGYGSMDWIELAQDRDRWGALMNTVMKLRVP